MSGSRPSLDNSANSAPPSSGPLCTPIRMLLGVCRAFVTAVIINTAVLRFHLVRVHLLALPLCVCVCPCVCVCVCVPMLYVFVCVSLFSSALFCFEPRFVAYFTFAFVSTQFKCFTFHAWHKINNNTPCCCFCSSCSSCCCCFCHVFIIINRAASWQLASF